MPHRECDHCGTVNLLKGLVACYCRSCGHRADVRRAECDCDRCRQSVARTQERLNHDAEDFSRVAARGLAKPVLSWTTDGDGATLRVEDETNSELFVEVRLSTRAVGDLLAAIALAAAQAKYRRPPTPPQ